VRYDGSFSDVTKSRRENGMRAFRALMAVLLFLCLLPLMSMAVAEFIA
jgi:hypothetical protein